jgi:hypothetical protein
MAVDGGKGPLISIVIPNWNGVAFLPVCLDSLISQSFRDFEVIVVDNGSTDNSRDLLASKYKWVQVVALDKNEGFAGGCNRGISPARGMWVVLMNNDTEAHKDWLKNIAAAIKNKPEYSFFATKILRFDKREILDGTGDFISRSLFVFRFGQFDTDKGQYDGLGEIFSPCGASAIYKKEMLDDVGLFDEDFFAYLEDIDLGMRAHIAGYRGFFVHDSVIYHIGGASTNSEQMSPWVYQQNIRNMFLILFKDIPFPVFLICIPSMIFWHSAHLFYVIRRRRELFKYYFIALYESLKLYRKMRIKRRGILGNKAISNSDLYQLLKRGSRLNWVQYKIRKRYFTSVGRVSH